MPFDKSVEAILRQAIEAGAFDDLPGKGKPIDLSAYFDTPEDVRLAYSILKNANVLPEEAQLLKEIAALKDEADTCSDSARKHKLQAAIQEHLLRYNLLCEQRKANR